VEERQEVRHWFTKQAEQQPGSTEEHASTCFKKGTQGTSRQEGEKLLPATSVASWKSFSLEQEWTSAPWKSSSSSVSAQPLVMPLVTPFEPLCAASPFTAPLWIPLLCTPSVGPSRDRRSWSRRRCHWPRWVLLEGSVEKRAGQRARSVCFDMSSAQDPRGPPPDESLSIPPTLANGGLDRLARAKSCARDRRSNPGGPRSCDAKRKTALGCGGWRLNKSLPVTPPPRLKPGATA